VLPCLLDYVGIVSVTGWREFLEIERTEVHGSGGSDVSHICLIVIVTSDYCA
jgi:hypothetical protein